MTDFIRTPDENFNNLKNYSFAANYHQWQDLRMHYVDEGPKDAPVVLMTHGMPTWSYLYRDIIPVLLKAGYRCIAPDHMGFGKSDKPTDANWYSIARHTEILTSLIIDLDLTDITLVCQDWGGPTGLAQAAAMPKRFSRLVIMNTWLAHDDYEYSDAITSWQNNWKAGGIFAGEKPNIALLMLISAGLLPAKEAIGGIVSGQVPELSGDALDNYRGFYAPVDGLGDEVYNAFRRFPLSIPIESNANGNGAAQSLHYRTLLQWDKPVHFIWGCQDDVFTESWGRKWAGQMNGSFDAVSDAGHFLQNTHGKQVAEFIVQRAGEA